MQASENVLAISRPRQVNRNYKTALAAQLI
jgi:hypothetical protein